MATPNKKAKRAQERFKHRVLHRSKAAPPSTPYSLKRPSSQIEPSSNLPTILDPNPITNILYDMRTGDMLVLTRSDTPLHSVLAGSHTQGHYKDYRSLYLQIPSGLRSQDLAIHFRVPHWKVEANDYYSLSRDQSLVRTVGKDTAGQNNSARQELSDRIGF